MHHRQTQVFLNTDYFGLEILMQSGQLDGTFISFGDGHILFSRARLTKWLNDRFDLQGTADEDVAEYLDQRLE